jgi:hypothetical protein
MSNIDDINEIILEEDPYLGLSVELENFPVMVYLSNLTPEVYPSKYVQNIDRLVTSLAQAKNASNNMFNDKKKIVKYLNSREKFTVFQVLKTAVYKGNVPEEYTTYILKDSDGTLYAIPEQELKESPKSYLTDYEKNLVKEFSDLNGKARVAIYFEKPKIYKNRKAPYDKKELDSVFDFFMSKIKGYKIEDVRKSSRHFRISVTIDMDSLVYLISEKDSLHIDDIEVIQ